MKSRHFSKFGCALAGAAVWAMGTVPSHAILQDDEASALFLAQKITENSGGTVQQYLAYARKLARTLSQFPATKQQEILGIVTGGAADDGNNGHGNDPGKFDPSNPGQGNGNGK